MDHIRKIVQRSGNPTWQANLRRFGLGRPQFATKELAEMALADAIRKRGAALDPNRREITFAKQAEAFLAHADGTQANKTLRSYRDLLKIYILPVFGAKRVIDITTPVLKQFLAEKRDSISNHTGKKLSATTLRLIRATMSVVFASAVEDRVIELNPVAAARQSRKSRKARAASNVAVPKERVFSHAQIEALLGWCRERDAELGDYLFTLLRSGMRPGEARALRWGDIHTASILVERSVDDCNEISLPKTGMTRSVDLSPALKDVLRLRQLKREREGHDVGPDRYVFGNGEPISAAEIIRRFNRAARDCRVEGHSLYDCRHTFASALYARCRDIVYTAKMLGHSDPSTTLRFYAHFLPVAGGSYVALLDEENSQIGSDLAAMGTDSRE